ncbi:Cyanovirin-N [Schizopora paradoxa]|uniref:Cyanovirin-N n=1 Tax=Schizopora paradoxa TaxID=27342 RepID=A0A0H2RFN5_9AGAM|nr:Cyanovirin-N [Schizopora paradoxa]
MKTTFLSSVVLALCALQVSGSPIEERSPSVQKEVREVDGGFVSTCTDTTVNTSNVVLTTTCRNAAGDPITSSISLNSCIANANGQVVFRVGGNFANSCPGRAFLFTSTSAEMFAQCDNDSGQLVSSTIDLNSVFTNNNGILTCP